MWERWVCLVSCNFQKIDQDLFRPLVKRQRFQWLSCTSRQEAHWIHHESKAGTGNRFVERDPHSPCTPSEKKQSRWRRWIGALEEMHFFNPRLYTVHNKSTGCLALLRTSCATATQRSSTRARREHVPEAGIINFPIMRRFCPELTDL